MADINVLTNNVVENEQAKINRELTAYDQQLTQETNQEKEKMRQKFVSRKLELEKESKHALDISMNSLNLKRRDEVLNVKQAIIRDYINEVRQALENLDANATMQFIHSVLTDYDNLEQLEIILGEKTRELLGDNLPVNVPVSSQAIPGKTGFILRQASIEYNYLFENLVDEKTSQLQQLLIQKIFKTS